MASKSIRIAVSLPEPLYRSVEAARRKNRCSRSTVVQDALGEWLRLERDAGLVRRYEAGYRRKPQTKLEIDAAKASAIETLSTAEW